MSRLEIGIGALVAAIVGLNWAGSEAFNYTLLVLGLFLIAQGAYDVYFKPNVGLDKTLTRWLGRHYWTVTKAEDAAKDKFRFAIWAEDPQKRKVLLAREQEMKGIIGFTAPVALDPALIKAIGTKLSAVEQQRLYEDLHVLLASMNLGYNTGIFTNMVVQHALLIDEHLSENMVDLKAKEVINGVVAARSLIQKAVL